MRTETFAWPERLAHYILKYDVRLPEEFVDHVALSPSASSDGGPPLYNDMGRVLALWKRQSGPINRVCRLTPVGG